jgi:hypothetical protein
VLLGPTKATASDYAQHGVPARCPAARRCWLAVKAMTKKLFADGYARHADVCAALGLSDNGGHQGRAARRARSPSRVLRCRNGISTCTMNVKGHRSSI